MIDRTREAPPALTNGKDVDANHQLPPGPDVKALPPPPTRRRRRGLGLLWLVLLAALGYAGFRYYQSSQKKKAQATAAQAARQAHRAVSVAATPARRGDLPVYLRGLGNVTAYNTVNVRSRVDG